MPLRTPRDSDYGNSYVSDRSIAREDVSEMTRAVISFLSVILLVLTGCSVPPSDDHLKAEIREFAKMCTWRFEGGEKGTYVTYLGSRREVESIAVTARSFEANQGSVRFNLKGKISGKPDDAWWGTGIVTDFAGHFIYEGEWNLKKYDTGWKIADQPGTRQARLVL